MLPADLLD